MGVRAGGKLCSENSSPVVPAECTRRGMSESFAVHVPLRTSPVL